MWTCLLLVFSQFPTADPPPRSYQEGNAAFLKQDFPRALSLYQQALATNPNNGEFLRSIGAVYAAQKQLPEARLWFHRACHASQPNALACFQAGRTWQIEQDYTRALALYERATTLQELGPRLTLATAQVLDRLGRALDAERAYRKAISQAALRPSESGDAQIFYANFLARQGRFTAALWQLEQAEGKLPADPRLVEERAKIARAQAASAP
ncbi:MAG: tetratricopeptide repeat protein [Bryobacter sp.]|nr:tetratricopeptide repeat protein [Bryobacter sp.]